MKELVKPSLTDEKYAGVGMYFEGACGRGATTCNKNCGNMCSRDISSSNRSILDGDDEIVF